MLDLKQYNSFLVSLGTFVLDLGRTSHLGDEFTLDMDCGDNFKKTRNHYLFRVGKKEG